MKENVSPKLRRFSADIAYREYFFVADEPSSLIGTALGAAILTAMAPMVIPMAAPAAAMSVLFGMAAGALTGGYISHRKGNKPNRIFWGAIFGLAAGAVTGAVLPGLVTGNVIAAAIAGAAALAGCAAGFNLGTIGGAFLAGGASWLITYAFAPRRSEILYNRSKEHGTLDKRYQ